MTNEKAIQLLHRLQDEQFDGIHGDERREALEMAIRALEGNGNMINRQAAIDAVDSETVITNPEHFKSNEKFIKFMDDSDISSFGKWQWANGFNTALVATSIHLKKLPSAQPERKKGKWILIKGSNGKDYHKCSECLHTQEITGVKNYCAVCGADMRGENDD